MFVFEGDSGFGCVGLFFEVFEDTERVDADFRLFMLADSQISVIDGIVRTCDYLLETGDRILEGHFAFAGDGALQAIV